MPNETEETLETTPTEESKETVEETVAEEPKQDLESLNKQLYMRAKKAEERAKELEKQVKEPVPLTDSVDAILEIQKATRGLDEDEVAFLRLQAKAAGKSLSEARKDDNFNLWKDARREKVEKAKALEPSSRQEAGEPGQKPLQDMTLKEKEEYFTTVVPMLRKHGQPPPPVFTPRV